MDQDITITKCSVTATMAHVTERAVQRHAERQQSKQPRAPQKRQGPHHYNMKKLQKWQRAARAQLQRSGDGARRSDEVFKEGQSCNKKTGSIFWLCFAAALSAFPRFSTYKQARREERPRVSRQHLRSRRTCRRNASSDDGGTARYYGAR